MCFSPTSFVSPHPSALRPLNYFDLPTSSRAAARTPARSISPPPPLSLHRHFHRLECAATNVFAALVALCVHLFLCVVFTRCPPASHCRVSHRVSPPRHFSCARLLDLPLIAFADHPVDTIDSPVTTLLPTFGLTTDAKPHSHCRALVPSVVADPPLVSCNGLALVSAGLSLLILVFDSSSSILHGSSSAVPSISCAAPRPRLRAETRFPATRRVAGARCLFRCPNSAPQRRLTNHTLRNDLLLEVCTRLSASLSVVCCLL